MFHVFDASCAGGARSALRHRAVALRCGVAVAALFAASPAWAVCQQSGSTVTCTDNSPPFGTGTETGLTITVVPGASIITSSKFVTDINIGSNNIVTNNGTIATGNISTGVHFGDNNYYYDVTNNNNTFTNNGTITVGNFSNAVFFTPGNNNTVTNAGTITLGDFSGGLAVVFGSNNTVTNSGTIKAGANAVNGSGIAMATFNSTITNTGTIALGSSSTGLMVSFSNNTVSNNTVINTGTISTGNQSNGILMSGVNNTVTNAGTITLANFSNGPGWGNQTSSFGIWTTGAGNIVTNTGTITVGGLGFGILTAGDNSTITNAGTVTGGIAMTGANSTLTNTGTVDGSVSITGAGDLLTNSGVITVTTGDVGTTHQVTGTFTQTAAGTLALRVNPAGAYDKMAVTGTANLGGMLGVVLQPGLYASTTTYAGMLTATNPITTKFAQTSAFAAGTTNPIPQSFFTVTPTYNANSVDITVNRTAFGALPGETRNQQATGNRLNAAYATTLTGAPATFFTNLLQATSAGVLDNLSGEGTSGTQNTAFVAGNMVMTTLFNQVFAWRDGDRVGIPTHPPRSATRPRGSRNIRSTPTPRASARQSTRRRPSCRRGTPGRRASAAPSRCPAIRVRAAPA
jgi:hypothetical protein